MTAFYRQALAGSSEAQGWLERHRLADVEGLETFGVGFADRTLGLSLPVKVRSTRTYGFDAATGQLTSMKATRPASTGEVVLQQDTMVYDAVGNVVSVNHDREGTMDDHWECFTYDGRQRLASAVSRDANGCASTVGGPGAYSRLTPVNELGNRVSNGTTAYTYPASGPTAARPHAPTTVGAVTLGWNLDGTLASSSAAGGTSYSWDVLDHLTQVSSPAGVSKMAYWPGGQRALLQDATGTHVYVGGVSERHKSPTGVFSATRSYSIGGTMVAVRNKTTGGPVSITALFGDRSGSITLGYTSSVAGGSQAEWYEPYGTRRAGGIEATHRGWIGQHTDTTSGLNYLNNRYYDPTIGIFISVDPLVDKTGQPYLYANGNPSTLSDPNGLDPCSHNGTCSGEYADQKDISNYNQSHGSPTVSKCNYQCALRSGTWGNGEGGFNRTAPSTMMYMKPASASQTVGLLLGVTLIAAAIAAAIALSPAEAIGASTPVVEELIDSGAGNQAQGAAQQVATEAESGAMSQMDRVGSGLKDDPLHRATSWVVDDPAAQQFTITGGDGVPRTLYQLPGEVNGKPGVFEWIVDSSGTDSVITHQRFIPGGQVTGLPNQP